MSSLNITLYSLKRKLWRQKTILPDKKTNNYKDRQNNYHYMLFKRNIQSYNLYWYEWNAIIYISYQNNFLITSNIKTEYDDIFVSSLFGFFLRGICAYDQSDTSVLSRDLKLTNENSVFGHLMVCSQSWDKLSPVVEKDSEQEHGHFVSVSTCLFKNKHRLY